MIHGQTIIGFTPCGRKRYMDLLAAHVVREHERGNIDKWVLFNNPYTIEDSTYARQLADHFSWIEVLAEDVTAPTRHAGQISEFYSRLTESEDVIYVRLDDDLCYIHEDAIPKLVEYRLGHPRPFLVYPTIINNTRTSYQLQQRGLIPKAWGEVEPILCAPMAWQNSAFVFKLHQKALNAIEWKSLLDEFTLPTEEFTDWDTGNISINCFAMFGRDMVACNVTRDEEGYLSKFRPHALGRFNARVGDAIVIHFAYHTQTEFMDKSGMLTDYARLVKPLPFRTVRLDPPPPPPPPPATPFAPQTPQQRALLHAMQRRQASALGLSA